jgi:hypothetical protein
MEFDYIYNKEIAKRYVKQEIKRLSKRKNRKRSTGAGRHFKLNLKDRFGMLLVYYRLYITYTLVGFLFDLDESTVCRDIQNIPKNKEAENSSRGSREIFTGFLAFTDYVEQQIPRPVDKERREMYYSIGKKKKHTVKNQFMVNNRGYILNKANHKQGKRHDYIFNI